MTGPEQVPEAVADRGQIPGGIVGLLVALACVVVFVTGFLVGMPELSYFLAGAVVVGGGIATILHFLHR